MRECQLFQQHQVSPKLRNYSEQHWMYLAVGILRVLFLKQVRIFNISGKFCCSLNNEQEHGIHEIVLKMLKT